MRSIDATYRGIGMALYAAASFVIPVPVIPLLTLPMIRLIRRRIMVTPSLVTGMIIVFWVTAVTRLPNLFIFSDTMAATVLSQMPYALMVMLTPTIRSLFFAMASLPTVVEHIALYFTAIKYHQKK